ncbi:type II toxin-antitoxin system CcdA family antitoxin [Roseomonas sp. HJA6]|uniref:Type II toxin-antitoxin system CcdA family antitoxin n=1 Tax=Roseomonas alba TaxID=2846776 RepID=A0ABS7A830_9PROT|nr:type II toxin-antitoxin system CcdA family antitoxin [Neoroseomonas alba]MBW6398469.1 type II toxin-antitoxin system CcdA family antitoxin [Neoroseomonas alba]
MVGPIGRGSRIGRLGQHHVALDVGKSHHWAMRNPEAQTAIDRAGGVSALAQRLGLDHSTVSGWKAVPARHVPAVAAAAGLGLHEVRPDLYRPGQQGGFTENQQPLVAEARGLGLDPEAIATKAITEAVRAEKAQRWLDENRDAIEAWNRWTEENELPLARYRMF